MRDHRRSQWRQFALFIAAVLVTLSTATLASAQLAEVRSVSGTADLLRSGTQLALARGAALHSNDQIVTMDDGRAEIAFTDGSTLVIGNNSSLILRKFDVAADQGRTGLIDLLQGIVRMALQPGPDTRVDIATHTAIASVRSTEWIVEAKPDTSAVFVITGKVTVAGNGVPGKVVLNPGEGTDVKADEPPSPPKAWGISRVRQVIERTRRP